MMKDDKVLEMIASVIITWIIVFINYMYWMSFGFRYSLWDGMLLFLDVAWVISITRMWCLRDRAKMKRSRL